MTQLRSIQHRFLFLIALTLLSALPTARAANCDDPHPLRLALIPKTNPETQLTQYRPLVQQLEKVLGRRVEVVPSLSYGTVIEGLLAGHIDLAELGPASYAIAMSRGAGITAFASASLRKGTHTDSISSYRSLLIVRRDSGYSKLAQLRDKTLSLTDPASTSGAVLPRQAISQLTGVLPETYFRRVTFAGSHDRAIESVQKKMVDAAFVASTRLDEALRRGTVGSNDLSVLWQSELIPYDPFVLRERLCPALQKRIREVFLGDTGALKAMFAELDLNGFVPVSNNQYGEIRALFTATP